MMLKRCAVLAACALLLTSAIRAEDKPAKPQVEVVFCLDTTGSMGGLINAAKQKIWSISNQIVSGKPSPDLKVGLVAYRDRKDAYVTKIFDLTDDLDAVHKNLNGFQAAGGNDTPESVNQAVHEAVSKIKWSKDERTLKIIFLVGDAPPHMDYKDDVQYPETCKLAIKKNIIINTVQCGNNSSTQKVWEEISKKSEGSYVKIAQNGGAVAIATPFDKRLGELNSKLARGTVAFGRAPARKKALEKASEAADLKGPGAADRVATLSKGGKTATYDLVDAVKNKKADLKTLKDDELPKALQGKTLEQKKQYLQKLDEERSKIRKEVIDLDKKRNHYIKEELAKKAKSTKKSSFDLQVLEMLRKQAKKHNINY